MDYKEQDGLQRYRVEISDTVLKKLADIELYIAENYSKISAKNKVTEIFDALGGLEIFPHGGFSVDERFGVRLDDTWETRGVPLKKDYLALYLIDENNSVVVVTDLFSTKSDYIKALKKD